jgi:hypothetical protein
VAEERKYTAVWEGDRLKVEVENYVEGGGPMTWHFDKELVRAVRLAGPAPLRIEVGVHHYALRAWKLPIGLRVAGDDGNLYYVVPDGAGGRWHSPAAVRSTPRFDPDEISGTIIYIPSDDEPFVDARLNCVFCSKSPSEAVKKDPGGPTYFKCPDGHGYGVPDGYDPVTFDYVLVGSK